MANILEVIERALQPEDPWRPVQVLAGEIKFTVPPKVIEERRRLRSLYRETNEKLNTVGLSIHRRIETEERRCRDAILKGESVRQKSKAELREEVGDEIRALKSGCRALLAQIEELCGPVRDGFVDLAESHIDAIEAAERAEAERFGIGYVPTALVTGLRRAVSQLVVPGTFFPWLD